VGLWGNSDPMREAGAPSTEEVVATLWAAVPAPPGMGMIAPQTLLSNA
jgi:hypothetical protein